MDLLRGLDDVRIRQDPHAKSYIGTIRATGHWPLTYQWPDRARGFSRVPPKCYVREPATGTIPMTELVTGLDGVWNCMKYELRQMREQGSGTVTKLG